LKNYNFLPEKWAFASQWVLGNAFTRFKPNHLVFLARLTAGKMLEQKENKKPNSPQSALPGKSHSMVTK
jgi:hypothetical protein